MLRTAEQILERAGIRDARREAGELYAAVVCAGTSAAFLDRDKPLAEPVRERLLVAAERRARHWPQAYAAGRANFRGHWLSVDQRVLIPRPETEGLVDLVLQETRRRADAQTLMVADVGTGSGAMAIAIALESAVSGVIATDVSADALNVAIENAQASGAKERIAFRRGDLLLPLLDDTVDVIMSNPPYIATVELDALDASVRDFEPRLALDGGVDGLEVIRRLVEQAPRSLNPGGLLALEIDARRAGQSAELARQAGFERVEIRHDLFGRPRYLLGRLPEHA